MKKSRLLTIIREELAKELSEYGMESIYYNHPGGAEQTKQAPEARLQRYDSLEKWRITAMQLGATVQDRGDDYIAVMPNQDKLGTFSKLNNFGTLNLYV